MDENLEADVENTIAGSGSAGPVSIEAGDTAGLFSLDQYAGEIVTQWWTPDKSQPERKIRFDIRIRALRSGHLNVINRRFNEIVQLPALVEFQQQQLSRCKPSREIERLQRKLDAVKDSDYEDGDRTPEQAIEAADAARIGFERQIAELEQEWKDKHEAIRAEIDRLLKMPSAYELLRAEFFSLVVDDHTIGWRGKKLDFNKPCAEGEEPPDTFAGDLRGWLMEVIGRGKVTRKNGGSAR